MKLMSKKYENYEGSVYDLTVENTKSYNVEGLAVHNSSAGSLVAFLSGITTVNPLEYGLIFERFHNREKKDFPDIDTDFSNPGLVKEYLREKYGEDRVASISNWSTLSPKVIVKDVARSLELGGSRSEAFKIANYITSIMPDAKTIEGAMKDSPLFKEQMDKYPELYINASKLQGLTRNWSVHAAGVVISDRPLYETVPLRIDKKTGLTITQWEKNRCEENGLVKMDLLGLKTLIVMDECLEIIKDSGGEQILIDDIPLDDEETYDMIAAGSTAGVFQLESTLTPLCRRIKPRDLEGISAINALGRPSCMPKTRETYMRRELGQEPIEVDHPTLKRALDKTNGILLYEESAMYIAQDCAGWDLNEADALRKISKLKGKNPQLVIDTENKFIKDCMKHINVGFSEAKHIWEEYISVLGGYAFNKSLLHSEKLNVIRSGEEIVVAISDVLSGDIIRTRNEKTKNDFYSVIKKKHYHGKLPVYKVELDSFESVCCTMNHKFRVADGQMLPLWLILKEDLNIVISREKTKLSKVNSAVLIGTYDTYDIELDTDDHQFYLANGILTSNSHSISYSHISVYTAWLRRHYPTEFMCALLNSEDPNSDKSQGYLEECKRMGIKVIPPDVRISRKEYVVKKPGVIVTGLSSIKGMGDSAVENILENKPYVTMSDFLLRTTARTVNKRAIQALAKSGGFDSFDLTRKDIHDNYAKFRTKINNRIKKLKKDPDFVSEIESRGLSIDEYDFHDNEELRNLPLNKVEEEWERKELLLNEKEALGRTISGTLHEIFGSFFKTNSSIVTPLSTIDEQPVKSKVKIEVIINNLVKEYTIKNGKNVGKKFAKYSIQDVHGNTSELTVWADDYEEYKNIFHDGTPIKAICSVTEYMGEKGLALATLERRI